MQAYAITEATVVGRPSRAITRIRFIGPRSYWWADVEWKSESVFSRVLPESPANFWLLSLTGFQGGDAFSVHPYPRKLTSSKR